MYDELIKRLYECVSGECWNCSQKADDYEGQRTCADKLMKEAADAIEELHQKLCDWCGVCPKERRRPWDCEIMWPDAPIPEVYIELPKEDRNDKSGT